LPIVRFAARVAAIVIALLVCVPLHYAWRMARRPSPWPRRFLGTVGRIAGLRVTIVGTPLRSHVLFAANHLSWLDIMLVAGATGAAFVSRDDVGRWPVIGWLARMNNTVFVDRSDRRAVRGQALTLRGALASGLPVALFPEGTTEGGEGVLPFRPSLFSSLFPALPGVAVQPVAIDYGDATREIAWVGREPPGRNARRILSRPGRVPVALHFLAPIDPAALPGRKALAEAARGEILSVLRPFEPGPDRL
jgi:1-acyl-sn-glycerol-3-phosphate acyltransferase